MTPSYKLTAAYLAIDWDSLPYGQDSDAAIARRMGLPPQWVRAERIARGIEPARGCRRSRPYLVANRNREIRAQSCARCGSPARYRYAGECLCGDCLREPSEPEHEHLGEKWGRHALGAI